MLNTAKLFANLPAGLRAELLDAYTQIMRNYVERRWEPAELNGGKLCEVVYTIIDGALSGQFAGSASKPSNMVAACRALETRPSVPSRVGDHSLRILLPRLLPVLYDIRNNRGVGHVGGDVSPNHVDAETVLAMASWLMAELVRVFHGVTVDEAEAAVDSLVQRRHPLIWQVGPVKRVLDPKMKAAHQVLLLAYTETAQVADETLCKSIEYSSRASFRQRVLLPLHKQRLIEYEAETSMVRITPRGIEYVETKLLSA